MSTAIVAAVVFDGVFHGLAPIPQAKSPGAGPVIVLETAKGTIEFETYPDEAPKTVARILELAKKGFYNGHRFHRAEPNFLVQVGDPTSRDVSKESWWGRAGSGKPIGASEISKKRRHMRGAVAMAHTGNPALADSQFYILLQPQAGPRRQIHRFRPRHLRHGRGGQASNGGTFSRRFP